MSALETLVILSRKRAIKRPRGGEEKNPEEKNKANPKETDPEEAETVDEPATHTPTNRFEAEFVRDKQRLEGKDSDITALVNLFASQTFSRFAEPYSAAQRHELRAILRRRFQQVLQERYYTSPLAMRQLLEKTAQPRLKRALVWAFMNQWVTLDDETLKLAYLPLFSQGLKTYGDWLRRELTLLYPEASTPPSTYLGGGVGDVITMALVKNNLETLELLRQIFPAGGPLWEEAATLDSENYSRILPATRAWLLQRVGVQVKEAQEEDPDDDEE